MSRLEDLIFRKLPPPIPSSDVTKLEHVECMEKFSLGGLEVSNPLDRIDQHFSASAENTIQIILLTQTVRKSLISPLISGCRTRTAKAKET